MKLLVDPVYSEATGEALQQMPGTTLWPTSSGVNDWFFPPSVTSTFKGWQKTEGVVGVIMLH